MGIYSPEHIYIIINNKNILNDSTLNKSKKVSAIDSYDVVEVWVSHELVCYPRAFTFFDIRDVQYAVAMRVHTSIRLQHYELV